jgi:prefoldin subunit 5
LGAIAAYLFVPRSGTVMETDSVLVNIGTGISLASPIGAVLGTMKAKSRKKPQAL